MDRSFKNLSPTSSPEKGSKLISLTYNLFKKQYVVKVVTVAVAVALAVVLVHNSCVQALQPQPMA